MTLVFNLNLIATAAAAIRGADRPVAVKCAVDHVRNGAQNDGGILNLVSASGVGGSLEDPRTTPKHAYGKELQILPSRKIRFICVLRGDARE